MTSTLWAACILIEAVIAYLAPVTQVPTVSSLSATGVAELPWPCFRIEFS